METFYNIKKLIKVTANDTRRQDRDFEYIPERRNIFGKIIPEHFEYSGGFKEYDVTLDEVMKKYLHLWYDDETKTLRYKYYITLYFEGGCEQNRYYSSLDLFDDAIRYVKNAIRGTGGNIISL